MLRRHVTRLLCVWVAAALLGQGCVAGQPAGESPAPAPEVELECRVKQYPCSLADVAIDVLRRSDELAQSADQMVVDGRPMADVVEFLRGQTDMAELVADEQAIRFRLTGGRPFWVMAPTALTPMSVEGGAASGGEVAMSGAGRTAAWSMGGGPTAPRPHRDDDPSGFQHVVGGNDEPKRALVLSAFLWEWGPNDEGNGVRAILAATRGYEGNVTYAANATIGATDVDVASFRGWGAYDVVHVVSHGYRICDDGGCRAIIAVRELFGGFLPTITDGRDLVFEDSPVVQAAGTEILSGNGRTILFLNADFFRAEYPGGLTDALVFFNACKTLGTEATDLSDSIRGSSSAFLGWNDSVWSDAAKEAALELYAELSGDGWRLDEAYEALGSLRQDPREPHAHLNLDDRPDGDSLRVREVVWLLDPAIDGQLVDGAHVVIDGKLGDGAQDGVPYEVQVDGFLDAAAGATVHVAVDGREVQRPLGSGVDLGDGQWRLTGSVPLGEDLQAERPATMAAWIELPDGGQSRDEVAVVLTGTGCLVGTWQLDLEEYEVLLDGLLSSLPGLAVVPATGRVVLEFGPVAPDRYGTITASYLGAADPPPPGGGVFTSGLTLATESGTGGVLFIQVKVTFRGGASAFYRATSEGMLEVTDTLPPGASREPSASPFEAISSDTRFFANGKEIPGEPFPLELQRYLSSFPTPIGGTTAYACVGDDTLVLTPEAGMSFTYRRVG